MYAGTRQFGPRPHQTVPGPIVFGGIGKDKANIAMTEGKQVPRGHASRFEIVSPYARNFGRRIEVPDRNGGDSLLFKQLIRRLRMIETNQRYAVDAMFQ